VSQTPRGDAITPEITIQGLSVETQQALKKRAEANGHDLESEIVAILDAAVQSVGRLKVGTAIFEICRSHGVTTADVEAVERAGLSPPAEPMRFE